MTTKTLSADQLRGLAGRYAFSPQVVQAVFDVVAPGPRNPLEKVENVLRRAMENHTDPMDEAKQGSAMNPTAEQLLALRKQISALQQQANAMAKQRGEAPPYATIEDFREDRFRLVWDSALAEAMGELSAGQWMQQQGIHVFLYQQGSHDIELTVDKLPIKMPTFLTEKVG